jgi:hypothetical protein
MLLITALTRLGVIGNWNNLAPGKSKMELATTALDVMITGSPFPRAEKTEFSITTASILGTKENRGIPCHAHGLPVERK